MGRTSLYVDGNALFHAIEDLNDPALKWLDPARLAHNLASVNATLVRVAFAFSVTGEDRAKAQHERIYLRALEALGVDCLVTDPMREYHECARCGHTWDERKARRNDADLGLEILHDAWSDAFDEAWLVTDQISESHLTRKLATFPSKTLTLFSLRNVPRLLHDTERLRRRTLTRKHLRAAMLVETVPTSHGEMIARPRGWAPRDSARWSDLEITGL